MAHANKNTQKKKTSNRPHRPRPVSAEERKMFWEMISRKGGIHIRF